MCFVRYSSLVSIWVKYFWVIKFWNSCITLRNCFSITYEYMYWCKSDIIHKFLLANFMKLIMKYKEVASNEPQRKVYVRILTVPYICTWNYKIGKIKQHVNSEISRINCRGGFSPIFFYRCDHFPFTVPNIWLTEMLLYMTCYYRELCECYSSVLALLLRKLT